MNYFEITFTAFPCNETINDLLSALAGEIGFESFMEHNNHLNGYVQQELSDEKALIEMINNFPIPNVRISYEIRQTEDKNWNEEWEKNYFQPILIGKRCVIHSTFHRNIPQAEYDIVINPQMAFGTGHHETTNLILNELLETDLKGKSVLDMGCGTSVLAILASMRGADTVTAIDIDDWCVENSKDNLRLNKIENVQVELGDARSLSGKDPFDIIIANINRNILLSDMKYYVKCMQPEAQIYMSGFYKEDIPLLKEEAEKYNLRFMYFKEKNNWAATKFILPK